MLSEISIPSGAIKRVNVIVPSIYCSVFQFLLVRLKAGSVSLYSLGTGISIPSGAIKSSTVYTGYAVSSEISIPSGAIKRDISKMLLSLSMIFQFLLVRLKEVVQQFVKAGISNFNSFWCD